MVQVVQRKQGESLAFWNDRTGKPMAEEFLQLENSDSDNEATTRSQANSGRERVKHLLIGSRKAVKVTINTLHVKGYAEANDWSRPVAAGELGEPGSVMCILFKSVSLD